MKFVLWFCLLCLPLGAQAAPGVGILLMAHGGSQKWNQDVRALAAKVNQQAPAEVAFGMANRATLQAGIDRLAARGVKRIVAVPLFVSSHSSVIEALRYLLGQRATAPTDLAELAGMGGMHKLGPKALMPVESPVPVRMASALDASPILAAILADRAAAIGSDPRHEVVLLVAHGPNDDGQNALWLQDMQKLAAAIEAARHYAGMECLTLRDDAEAPVRNAATAKLRQAAQQALAAGDHVLVVPLLLSYGGIENGLRQRLDGIEHTFSPQAVLPDARLAEWVLQQAGGAE